MASVSTAKEAQNQSQVEAYRDLGPATMGPWTSHIWRSDPRHMCFLLSRYKFVAKMLAGKASVLEVGCGDAVGTPIVLQTVGSVHGIDFEPLVLEDAIQRYRREGVARATFAVHDVAARPVPGRYDAAFSLDVIEHVPAQQENVFLDHICAALTPQAVCILGTPNITANEYASPASKAGHINLKSAETLRELLARRFHNVFGFGMNDEVVHTGYAPMAHYLFAIGVGVKG
jgi:2-polyprenyl-3-methyl-5-hydroxy-6-metoxy-1,4-benzoquinol methylase